MPNEGEPLPVILVVEDEWLVAAMIEQAVEEAGYAVAGPARNPSEALALLSKTRVVGALLDVSVGSEKSFAVADELIRLGLPFVFMTGYSAEDLPAAYRSAPLLAKPLDQRDVVRALRVMGPSKAATT